ncbi:hypothetical protein TCDM_10304 [Trypanosoma cruzi Dm28c]|uniref:Uncharacterized protein n=1 Tax=Trypanosoma cruzi Dm28c TaxID=1416333 RepID=V5D3P3_TRYCR|nr:hypothetical protein TCDM_10304 [Trypanosoma cruzi Dm28c]
MAARQRGHPRQKLPLATASNVPCGPHTTLRIMRDQPPPTHFIANALQSATTNTAKRVPTPPTAGTSVPHTQHQKKKQRRSEPSRTPPHTRHKASPIICVVQPRRQQRIQGHTQPLPSPLPETQGEKYTAARTRHKRASRAAAMRSVPIHSPLFCVGKRLRP